jgi:prephenate dehydrogenase
MNKYQIGIIGYGDFTKVMLEYLAPYADIVVSSRSRETGDAGFGARFKPLSEVLSCDIIIPSIPAQFFEEFFTQNRDFINPGALVIDVSSVKIRPLDVLQRLLPETCQIIGTHPMFGPASIAKNNGIKGLRCVVCPVRVPNEKFSSIKQLLQTNLKLEVLERTPEQHDREMAYVQGLSHYIGRVMDCMKIPESELATLAYEDLLDMKKIQGGDSWDLYASIMLQNPYAAEVNAQFKQACDLLDEKLSSVRQ